MDPRELESLYHEISNTDIAFLDSHLNSLTSHMDNQLAEQYKLHVKHRRCSPLTLFSEITRDPETLLKVMRDCKVVLSGSRAVNYFCLGLTRESSDWDFYCTSTILSVCTFWRYLSLVGVEWIGPLTPENDNSGSVDLAGVQGELYNSVGKQIKINIHWSKEEFSHPSKIIVNFHSSITQCVVTGFAAVSLYGNSASYRTSVAWKTHVLHSNKLNNINENGVSKYKNRGIRYISYSELENHYSERPNNSQNIGSKLRQFCDEECTFVSFTQYMSKTEDKVLSERYIHNLAYIQFIERISHLDYIDSIVTQLGPERLAKAKLPILQTESIYYRDGQYGVIGDLDKECQCIKITPEAERDVSITNDELGIPMTRYAWNRLLYSTSRLPLLENTELLPC